MHCLVLSCVCLCAGLLLVVGIGVILGIALGFSMLAIAVLLLQRYVHSHWEGRGVYRGGDSKLCAILWTAFEMARWIPFHMITEICLESCRRERSHSEREIVEPSLLIIYIDVVLRLNIDVLPVRWNTKQLKCNRFKISLIDHLLVALFLHASWSVDIMVRLGWCIKWHGLT